MNGRGALLLPRRVQWSYGIRDFRCARGTETSRATERVKTVGTIRVRSYNFNRSGAVVHAPDEALFLQDREVNENRSLRLRRKAKMNRHLDQRRRDAITGVPVFDEGKNFRLWRREPHHDSHSPLLIRR